MTLPVALSLVRWLHLLAAVVWLGGSLFLVVVLHPALRRNAEPAAYLPLVRQVARRFRPWGLGSLAVLLVTGVALLVGTWGWRIPGAPYGTMLLVKLGLVLLLLVLTVAHDFWLGPRLGRLAQASGTSEEERYRLQRRVRDLGRATTILGLLIVLAAAALASLH